MTESYRNQLQDPSFKDLSFEDRFGLIIDTEWSRRKNNKLTSLIRKSEFSSNDACIENIEYHADRKLDKAQITRLSTCNYIQEKHNIIILGASGAGKTYVSCSFGIAACRMALKDW
ncbi:ATP-binding protein [Clostridium tagluense]|uniref:ATP-binding protein n=1 Tax=Clostridium tagluense TaxID=360422 RepID=UPI0034E22984